VALQDLTPRILPEKRLLNLFLTMIFKVFAGESRSCLGPTPVTALTYVPSEVPFKSSTTQLLVYLPSVACFYDQNPHNAILNFAEHSIVSNPISPQFPKGAG
jgi:hypothetical protein